MGKLDIRVKENDLFVFETTLPVMINHVNYGKNLGQDALMTLLQEARMRYLGQDDMTETTLEDSVGFMVSEASISYKNQAFFGDNLKVQIYAPRFRKNARIFNFNYQVIRLSDGVVVAEAATSHVFFDFIKQKVTTCPHAFYWMIHRNLQLITQAA